MNIKEIIEDLISQIQALEDTKTELTERQEDLRQTICYLQCALEVKENV